MNKFIIRMASRLYSSEIVLTAIKYAPEVISFEFDTSVEDGSFVLTVMTEMTDEEDLCSRLMERVCFVYLRLGLYKQTQIERELIIGRALYRSCIQNVGE